jgi:hypothetical protein
MCQCMCIRIERRNHEDNEQNTNLQHNAILVLRDRWVFKTILER